MSGISSESSTIQHRLLQKLCNSGHFAFCNVTPLINIVIQEKLTLTDMGILMTAAVCHDLDHPGYNNT